MKKIKSKITPKEEDRDDIRDNIEALSIKEDNIEPILIVDFQIKEGMKANIHIRDKGVIFYYSLGKIKIVSGKDIIFENGFLEIECQ
ncbi:MAG: hypothetical protein ACOYWZ_04545 [Bacillota bacterium]